MSIAVKDDNPYQLTVVPYEFYQLNGVPRVATCVIDNHELELLDRFEDKVQNGISSGFYYEGDFMMCPVCGHPHYVVDHANHLMGPVTLQWAN